MKTIVVRNPTGAIMLESAPGPSGTVSYGLEALAASVAAETAISVEDLSAGDRADLEARPDFLTANSIPLSLIQPSRRRDPVGGENPYADYVEVDDQGGTAAWGIVATKASSSGFTGRDVPVAVLDTGIDRNHPAFAGVNIVTQNFTDEVDEDVDGHGTHCAGTIFGRDVDGVRIGVARGVTQAFIAKVLPGSSDALVEALNWVFASGARVASMSLGYDFPAWVQKLKNEYDVPEPAAISMALRDFRANIATFDAQMGLFRARSMNGGGMVVVAASGNESERRLQAPRRPYTISVSPPAAATGVIAVGALERTAAAGLAVTEFSNTSPQLSAPGLGVLSARAGGQDLVAYDGTSMACPYVAGLAALYWDAAIHGPGGATGPDTIVNRLTGRALTDALQQGFSRLDVGNGLPMAP